MKKQHHFLSAALILFTLIGGACTKENMKAANYKKQSTNQTVQPASESSESPVASSSPDEQAATGGCQHRH